MSEGWVYVLSNEHMPGLTKIGRTTRDVEARAAELFQTGVPSPFIVEHCVLSPDCSQLESAVHHYGREYRLSENREFFRLSVDQAVSLVRRVQAEQIDRWVSRFLPGHLAIPSALSLDADHLLDLSGSLSLSAKSVIDAFSEISADELRPAADRARARRAEHLQIVEAVHGQSSD